MNELYDAPDVNNWCYKTNRIHQYNKKKDPGHSMPRGSSQVVKLLKVTYKLKRTLPYIKQFRTSTFKLVKEAAGRRSNQLAKRNWEYVIFFFF